MKGLYMVDADRGFVQYFENLLFTNSQEYKMLGHNFKANDFLTKIKERPELLGKIDLLLVNPKLNDLNGLELVKKILVYKPDINICILVNENIKTFYENDIAELGIEHVLVYPNDDNYYLNSVRRVFESIENGVKKASAPSYVSNTNMEQVSEKDVFSELNSSDFLKQFDFDSLSDDFFKNKNTSNGDGRNNSFAPQQEETHRAEAMPKHDINKNNGIGGYGHFDSFEAQNNPTQSTKEGFNNFREPSFDFNNGGNRNVVKPNFGHDNNEVEDVPKNDFGYNKPVFETPDFNSRGYEYEEPNIGHNTTSQYENNSFDQNQNKYGGNPFGQGNDIPGNPLDLSAFGVPNSNGMGNNPENAHNIFEEPNFDNHVDNKTFGYMENNNSFGQDNMNNNYGLQDRNVNQANPYLNPLDTEGVDLPYENRGTNQATHLQDINRPDIDSVDTFENYGQPSIQNPYENANNIDFNGYQGEPVGADRHQGFNGANNRDNSRNDNFNHSFGNNNAFANSPVQPTPPQPTTVQPPAQSRMKNPYEEYRLHTQNRQAESNSQFGGNPNSGFGFNEPNFGNYNGQNRFEPNESSNAFNNPSQVKPNDFDFSQNKDFGFNGNGASHGNEDNQKQFTGFDFNKPSAVESAPQNNDTNGFTGFDFNKPSMGERESLNNLGNKYVIEDMYNNTGVDSLSYTPTMNNNDKIAPITHERTSGSAYKEIPDFAKQVVAFYSTKGGIGKTSLAVNSTIQLAKYSKKKICLIDFDVTNANVHTHLGILDSTYDLSVISNFESEIDSFSLSRIVTPYRVKDKNGETVEFDVIVGFKEMKMSQRFTEKEVYKILCILEEMYDIVIVDTHPVYTDLAVSTILKKATKIVFVSEQEMTALNGAKDFILTSKRYGIPAEKLFMVLNRYKSQTSIFTKNRIEKGLNKTVLATIPSDMDSIRDAVNTNNPVTISNPDSELARAYIDVAKIIDTNLVVPEETKGFFKRFKR